MGVWYLEAPDELVVRQLGLNVFASWWIGDLVHFVACFANTDFFVLTSLDLVFFY